MSELDQRLKIARQISWQHLGKQIKFYLPGIFLLDGISGKYPAASITGERCALQCDHCQGKILRSMLQTETPERLVTQCLELSKKGQYGVLISGGCDLSGRLPWSLYVPAIKEIKKRTNLFISVHSGLVDACEAQHLKAAGVDQALIDVVGDDETFQQIYHVPFGVERIQESMAALQAAGLPTVPHIVCGLNHGKLRGEKTAVQMVARFNVEQLAIVSLIGIPGTPMFRVRPPAPEAIADIIADARYLMPSTAISLGCARQRGNSRLEILAIDAGVNRMALPSDEAIAKAKEYGLTIRYQKTCCSVPNDLSIPNWRSDHTSKGV
jgi:hypothetical protein